MFDDMEAMLYRIKKKVYKERMAIFCEKNADTLREMTGFVEQAENKEEAAAQMATAFGDMVQDRFGKRGKISGRSQMDINVFMIYYVFPSILLTNSECARILADAIRTSGAAVSGTARRSGIRPLRSFAAPFRRNFWGFFKPACGTSKEEKPSFLDEI